MKTLLCGTLMITAGLAQDRVFIERFGAAGAPVEFGAQTFDYVSTKLAFDDAVVKGAPYSADAITEMTQTLADGNRIHRTTKATLYRDGEGRTRHEQTLGEIGPLTSAGEPIQSIVINDPVAGTTYMLNSREKVAHKMPAKAAIGARVMTELTTARSKAEGERSTSESFRTETYSVRIRRGGEGEQRNVKTESLGTNIIEGIPAEGTRTTLTIPAGAVGNERPIEVVTERWYSSQLHTTVMTRTVDPRMGETAYSLKNIKLGEPPHSLFEVPADYTVR